MSKAAYIIRQGDFSGGENFTSAFVGMKPKFSRLMKNLMVSERGGVRLVPGYSRVNPTALSEALVNGFRYLKSDGTVTDLVAGSGKIYKVDAANSNELALVHSGLDVNAKVFFSQMNDAVLITNGVDDELVYDGSTVSAMQDTPAGSCFVKTHVFEGRVWAVDALDTMVAFHSALRDYNDWSSADNAGYIDFKFILPVGDTLMDIQSFSGYIVFVFENHVVLYSGTDPTAGGDFAIKQIISGSGAAAYGASVSLESDLYYVSRSGIRSLREEAVSGNLKGRSVSEHIDDDLVANVLTASHIAIAPYPSRGWLLFLIGDVIYIYSPDHKAWGRISGTTALGLFGTAGGDLFLTGTGLLYEYGTGYDFDGSAMSWQWSTAYFTLFRSGLEGYPKHVEIVNGEGPAVQATCQVYHDLNQMSTPFTFNMKPPPSQMDTPVMDVWENVFFMDNAFREELKVPLFGGGRTMQLVFSGETTEGPIEFNDLAIQVVPGGF